MSAELTEVVIDRAKWYRGKGPQYSRLLRVDGMMCCIGFACLARGNTPQRILNRLSPVSASRGGAINLSGLLGGDGFNTAECADMMSINDDMEISDAERESELIPLAQQAGFKFTFIN